MMSCIEKLKASSLELSSTLVITWVFSFMWLNDRLEKSLVVPVVLLLVVAISNKGFKFYLDKIRNSRLIILLILSTLYLEVYNSIYGGVNNDTIRGCYFVFALVVFLAPISISRFTRVLSFSLLIHSFYFYYSLDVLGQARPQTFTNPNIYAPMFGLLSIFSIFILLGTDFIKGKIDYFLTLTNLLLSLSFLLIMSSRNMLLSVIVVFGLGILLSIKSFLKNNVRKRKWLGVSALAVILISVGFFTNVDRLNRIYYKTASEVKAITSGNLETSIGYRIQMYKFAFELLSENPITGWGNDYKIIADNMLRDGLITKSANHYMKRRFHNSYLDVWVKQGLPMFVVLVGAVAFLLVKFYCTTPSSFKPEFSLLLYICITSLFDSSFQQGVIPITLCILLLALIRERQCKK